MAREELTRLTGNGNGECGEDDCPNVYRTERRTFVIQRDVSKAFAPLQGEGLVEVPESVLREASLVSETTDATSGFLCSPPVDG